MFIKSFVTILLALIYFGVLTINIIPTKNAPVSVQITMKLVTMTIKATTGAWFVVFMHHIWS